MGIPYLDPTVEELLWLNNQSAPVIPQAPFFLPLVTSISEGRFPGSSTPTFTRASTAYQQDFEGKFNAVLSEEARFQGPRRVANLIPAAGTGSASLANGANKTATVVVGTYVFSIGAEATGTNLITFTGTATGSSGTLTANATKRASTVLTIIGGGTIIATSTTLAAIDLMLENVTGQANQNPSEYVSVGVLSAPYHGAGVDGVKYFDTLNGNTVTNNVVTEATGAHIDSSQAAAAGGVTAGVVDATGPKGLITEASATNSILYSQQLENAAWAGSTVTVTPNSDVAPDGTTTADTLTVTVAGQDLRETGFAITPLTSTVVSIFVKKTTASGIYSILRSIYYGVSDRDKRDVINTDAGTATTNLGSVVVSNAGAYWKVDGLWTDNASNTNFDLIFYPAANTDGSSTLNGTTGSKVAWGFQLAKATAIASSYIPTTTVAVTRPADVEQYVSAGNLSATAMTIAMKITPSTALGSATIFHFGTYVDASNYTAILSDGTNLIARKRIAGANTDATAAFTRTVGTTVKAVARFDTTNGIDVWLGGTKGTGSATLTASQIGTNFQIGGDGNGANQDYMEHRLFQVWQQSLNDVQCAILSR